MAKLSYEHVGETFMDDSGPRTVIGGMDMDQDGINEMIVTEYSGHRVIVMEYDSGTNQFNGLVYVTSLMMRSTNGQTPEPLALVTLIVMENRKSFFHPVR